MRHVALLRGINVGGKHRVPMADLRALFEENGCRDVETFIQSGNVVFAATESALPKLARTLPMAMEKKFGFPIPLVLRTAKELAAVTKTNPYLAKSGPESNALHVVFLRDLPEKAAIAAMDPNRSPGDEFTILGRDVFVNCPKGVGQTKLTNAWFDSKLKTISTGRNWRTVLALLELSQR
jgi:uncharacterized protein (DUF1697 family)